MRSSFSGLPAVSRFDVITVSLLLPLPPGEGWGEGINSGDGLIYPLFLAFSRREKGFSFVSGEALERP